MIVVQAPRPAADALLGLGNWRRGIPRWAACTLAFRRIGSGIASVVFMSPWSHIYGRAAYAFQTICPATMVATGPPRKVAPSNGELRLLEKDLLTS